MTEIKHDSQKLTVQNLEITGIFCAVFFVFMMLGAGVVHLFCVVSQAT